MSSCKICKSGLEPIISFGKMPIANNFLRPEQFDEEYFFNLEVGFCENCKMVQLMELVAREKMFHDQYAYYSSTSSRMAAHFKSFADDICREYLRGKDPFVVEMGSNDGIMLRNFVGQGIRHLGVEPSANVAQVAIDQGMNVITEFMDVDLADRIVSENGRADAVLGANVMCHIPYLHSVVEGIKLLLKPDGVLVFEDPYLGDIIQKTSYDQIYDEHAFYFSLTSVRNFFDGYDMEIIHAEPQNVHGGSMRYYIANRNSYPVSPQVDKLIEQETVLGFHEIATYHELAGKIDRSRQDLVGLLAKLKGEGKRVVGYGATSKSTTVLNYCRITDDLVEFISDTTPIKQGKFSPGAHIPIRPYDNFATAYPDYALLFAWNHGEEIIANEREFVEQGGKFIVYVPAVGIVG